MEPPGPSSRGLRNGALGPFARKMRVISGRPQSPTGNGQIVGNPRQVEPDSGLLAASSYCPVSSGVGSTPGR